MTSEKSIVNINEYNEWKIYFFKTLSNREGIKYKKKRSITKRGSITIHEDFARMHDFQ